MNHLDRILVFIVLFSISGTLITSYLSNEYNTHTIGHKELNNLHNISNLDISEYNAYLYTNDTEIPEFKYFIGNQDLFNVYLKNVTTETNIIYTNKKNIYKSILSNLPTILFLYFIIKSLNSQMKLYSGSFNDNINKITKTEISFNDIAGLKEVKEEVKEFIDILKGEDKFKKMNCKTPRGALFYGEPGTGKTLIAKAIATECKTNFIHVSGSSFNEIYVGVGQSRVKKLFQNARDKKPCIIFIDEIDTLGKKRGKNSEGHNEHENTLNSLLSEMDGIDTNDSVLIFGATNRPEMLDPALTRSGRFDRKIEFNLPNLKERVEILSLYLKKYPIKDNSHTLAIGISKNTYGFSGADLRNLCNEAAIKSVRNGKDKIDNIELDNAINYILVGSKRESSKLVKSDRITVAHHEAGHAFLSYIQNGVESPCKISIIPTTKGALGYSMSQNKEKNLSTKNELLQQMAVILGGRCSESVFLDDITTGASNDLEKLRKLAKLYVGYYGLSDKLKNLNITDDILSDKTKQLIDTEIQKLINDVEIYTTKILEDNKDNIKKMVKLLLKNEDVSGNELRIILGKKLESSINKFMIKI